MKSRVALVIIFNHRYDKNIPVLKKLYAEKFSHVYFLVPFYDGSEAGVIPVYENSHQFQGYIAQGFKSYFNEAFDHYLFIGDDLILNPAITEHNYADWFQLKSDESFIPEVFALHSFTNAHTMDVITILTAKKGTTKLYWGRTRQAYYYSPNAQGVETANQLPSYAEAEKRLRHHGFLMQPLQYSDMFGGIMPGGSLTYKAVRMGKLLVNGPKLSKKFPLSYPLVAAYSDIVLVSKATISQFIQYCGVFAATGLFVEMAIPTALLLASDKVKTEPAIGKRGTLYWNYGPQRKAKYSSDMQQYHFELRQLLERFPEGKLYIHPVKLSRWKLEGI